MVEEAIRKDRGCCHVILFSMGHRSFRFSYKSVLIRTPELLKMETPFLCGGEKLLSPRFLFWSAFQLLLRWYWRLPVQSATWPSALGLATPHTVVGECSFKIRELHVCEAVEVFSPTRS